MNRLAPIFAAILFSVSLLAQTPDSRHLKVEYEDERLRVMRLTLEPGESSGEIQLNERINVSGTDGKIRVTFDGKDLGVIDVKAGSVRHEPAARFSIENVGTSQFQTIITEFKPGFAHASPPPQTPPMKTPPSELARASANPPGQVVVQPAPPMREVPASPVENPAPAAPSQQPTARPMDQPPSSVEPTALNVDGAKVAFLNGTELAYIERGQGSHIVVLVHDTLGDYRSWAPQLTALAKNYRVIAYSRRYHYPNHSTGKEHDYTYDINAKELADFIRGLNAGPVRLVGFGYGATIAGMVASEHPELVKALVLTEPAYEQMLDKTMAFRSQFAREEIYGDVRKPLTKEKADKGVQMFVDWQGYQSWAGISAEEQFRKKQNANALHAQTFDASPPTFACATAKKIAAPTLILSGQRRSPNSAEIAGVLSACVPNAERATVPNAGAAVYVDNPADADKLLVEFLGKH